MVSMHEVAVKAKQQTKKECFIFPPPPVARQLLSRQVDDSFVLPQVRSLQDKGRPIEALNLVGEYHGVARVCSGGVGFFPQGQFITIQRTQEVVFIRLGSAVDLNGSQQTEPFRITGSGGIFNFVADIEDSMLVRDGWVDTR